MPRTLPTARSLPTALFVSLLTLAPVARAQSVPVKQTGIVVADRARFTVITPGCIRIESAGASGGFVDLPSLFAANRAARFTGYTLRQSAGATTIDTGIIRLTYSPNGQPLGPNNLSATIRKGGRTANWRPGAPNGGNLGGTVRTLDNWDGPGDLGEGVVSRDGWYLLDDSKSPLLTADWLAERPAAAGTDWYLFGYGTDYKSALKSLTVVGGPVPLPRRYLLGAWYSRFWPYTSADYRQIVAEYKAHDFPLDNMVLDMDWHKDGWTGWSWNRTLLPDPAGLLSWLHRQGLSVTLNVHPADGVGPHEDAYAAFMTAMGEDPAGGKTLPFDAGDKKYLDTMFRATHDPLVRDGVDFWWLDWQQYPNTRSLPSLTNLASLNRYYYSYTAKNDQRGVSFSRWAGWGDHRHPIHFSGDASTNWRMLAFEVPMTATAGNVGCFFWSHDIGGHNMGRNEESYTRWCQFGALTAALRSHSTRDKNMDRRPWAYAKWAEESMRRSFHLRSELFPYIYTSAARSARDSVPLSRPLYLDFPGDENAYHNAQEFLFGDSLLAAPIVTPGIGPRRVGRQAVYFPKGEWVNVFTGERFVGPSESLVSADIDEMPLYARAGAPLPMQPYTSRMASTPLTTLRVRCFPGPDGVTVPSSLYEDDGVTVRYRTGAFATTPLSYLRRGRTVTVRIGAAKGSYKGQPNQRAYRVELPLTARPVTVTVDGKPAAFVYDPATAETRITVAGRPLRRAVTVQAVLSHERPGGDASLAAARRRVAGILGKSTAGLSRRQLLALAGRTEDADRRAAVLAACGVGVLRKSQAPYLFGGKQNLTFYAPFGVIDADKVQAIPADPDAALAPPARVRNSLPLVLSSSDARKDPAAAASVQFRINGQPFDLAESNVMPGNVAPFAGVTVNGTESGYNLAGLTDGIREGYPLNRNAEWSSDRTVGAFLTLSWDRARTIDTILLFDRPNATDQVTAGNVLFSDGTSIAVGELPNDGQTPLTLKFPAKRVTSLRFEVTGVRQGTEHAGLSEIAVLAVSPPFREAAPIRVSPPGPRD